MNTLDQIRLAGIVPVAVFLDANDAVPAVEAILAGGLNIIEITLRTEAAIQAIRNVSNVYPDVLIGAGTVLTLEKCQEALDAGAKFIVSPGFNEKIVAWCVDKNIPITPGCVTPTEIETALSYGINIVKFFPADIFGGVKACKSLYGPYRLMNISFIPTGGINNDNLSEYADKPFIHAVGGSWLCPSSAVVDQKFDLITRIVSSAIDIMLGFTIDHMGINFVCNSETKNKVSKIIQDLNIPINEEINLYSRELTTNLSYKDEHGYIALQTNNIDRAIYYLSKRGFRVNEATAKYDNDIMISVFLEDSIVGFSILLLQK